MANEVALKEHLPHRVLPISVLESPSGFLVKADLPGIPREKIKVEFELGLLFLEAEMKPTQGLEEEDLLQEVAPCHYKRTLKMGSEIDAESIRASMELGVLTVTLPKKESALKREIPIN